MKTLDDELRKPTKQQRDEEKKKKIARAAKKVKQEKLEKKRIILEYMVKERNKTPEQKAKEWTAEIFKKQEPKNNILLEDFGATSLIPKSSEPITDYSTYFKKDPFKIEHHTPNKLINVDNFKKVSPLESKITRVPKPKTVGSLSRTNKDILEKQDIKINPPTIAKYDTIDKTVKKTKTKRTKSVFQAVFVSLALIVCGTAISNYKNPQSHISHLAKKATAKIKSSSNIESIVNKTKSSKTGRLYITTKPRGATVKVMNIRPKYKSGIWLNDGYHKIRVEAKGYKTLNKIVKVRGGEKNTYKLVLQKKKTGFYSNLGTLIKNYQVPKEIPLTANSKVSLVQLNKSPQKEIVVEDSIAHRNGKISKFTFYNLINGEYRPILTLDPRTRAKAKKHIDVTKSEYKLLGPNKYGNQVILQLIKSSKTHYTEEGKPYFTMVGYEYQVRPGSKKYRTRK